MLPKQIIRTALVTGLFAFSPGAFPQNKPAPVSKPAAAAASPVDNVVKLLKSGMAETLIVKTLQKQKPYTPSPEEMVKLKEAGASDNLIGVLMDPASAASLPATAPAAVAAAPAPAPPPAPVAAEVKGADCPAPAAVNAASNAAKRRVAINAFDYQAVKTAVTQIAGNDVNIGAGIRSMLLVKMAQSNSVVLLEREKIQQVMKEQDFGATNRVKQGTNAKIGQITGADAELFGTIVTFGRDDQHKGNAAGGVARALPGPFGAIGGRMADSKKSDKAVVVINLRLVDAETGEVIDAEEARGESARTSTNWGAVAGSWRGGAGASADMTSSNFGETIIGEATQDAVNKIAAILEQKMAGVSAKSRTIEGRVANVDGCTLYLSVGGNDGVHVGDHFEILRIVKEIRDPATKEVIDTQTEKIGDMFVGTVRDKMAVGQYGGRPISAAYITQPGYAARMATQ